MILPAVRRGSGDALGSGDDDQCAHCAPFWAEWSTGPTPSPDRVFSRATPMQPPEPAGGAESCGLEERARDLCCACLLPRLGHGRRTFELREREVDLLLRLSRAIDALNERVGHLVYWLILAAALVSAGNASVRYAFDTSSNAWLELQWYLYSAVFLLCAGYTLLRNEHVRIDVIIGHLPPKLRAWIDLLGGVLFLLPMAVVIMFLSWPVVVESYVRHEFSADAGGLLRWPVKLLIPVGFLLLALQGVSEIVKRALFLAGHIPDPVEAHHEPVAEEMLKGSVE